MSLWMKQIMQLTNFDSLSSSTPFDSILLLDKQFNSEKLNSVTDKVIETDKSIEETESQITLVNEEESSMTLVHEEENPKRGNSNQIEESIINDEIMSKVVDTETRVLNYDGIPVNNISESSETTHKSNRRSSRPPAYNDR